MKRVRRPRAQQGFAMAALLVALGVMSLMLSIALPVWHHAAQGEREAELIFRGEQYARAIMLYQRQPPAPTHPLSRDGFCAAPTAIR